MEKLKDIIVYSLAVFGIVSLFINASVPTQTSTVKIDSYQFRQLKEGLEDIQIKLNDVNISAVGGKDAAYLISSGDGVWLLNVKNN
jgi:hypothetical protein